MSQFEIYWEKKHPIYDSGSDTFAEYLAARAAWRELLGWLIDEGCGLPEGERFGSCTVELMAEEYDKIKEEEMEK